MRRLAVAAACIIALTGCTASQRAPSPPLGRFEFSQVHMGVRARLVLYARDQAEATDAASAAFERIAEIDAIMSDYRVDSELMRLGARAGQGPVPVSDELFEVLVISGDLHARSSGSFDVTAGPLVQLWREMRRSGQLAAAQEIAAARALVGGRWVRLDARAQTVELLQPGMRLDLGGIAKGYACDGAAAVLRQCGISRYLVAMAGDIVVGEPPPDRDAWEVAVEGGVSGSGDSEAPVVRLVNAAVSTSGDAQQFVEIAGRRYSHIVDPRTGFGSSRRIAATVIAPSGMLSDSLATALCLLPMDSGLALVAEYEGVEALIEEGLDGSSQIHATPGMARWLAQRKKSVP